MIDSPPVPATQLPELAIVGQVRRSHGVKGDLAVEAHTDAPDAVFAPGARVFIGTSISPEPKTLRECAVRSATPMGKGLRIHLEGVDDRDSADLLRQRFFFVPLGELAPPLEDEVFRHDLIGMQVATSSGVEIGAVAGWYEMPQGIILEVTNAGKEILIPYRDEFVRAVDPGERRITVELPEGFLD